MYLILNVPVEFGIYICLVNPIEADASFDLESG